MRIAPGFHHQVHRALRGLHLFADGGQQGEVDPFTVESEVQTIFGQGKGKGEQGDLDRDRPFPDQPGVQGADFQIAGHLRLFSLVIERGGQGLDGNVLDLAVAQGDLAVDGRGPGGAGQSQPAVELPRGGQAQGRQEAGVQVPDLQNAGQFLVPGQAGDGHGAAVHLKRSRRDFPAGEEADRKSGLILDLQGLAVPGEPGDVQDQGPGRQICGPRRLELGLLGRGGGYLELPPATGAAGIEMDPGESAPGGAKPCAQQLQASG